MDVRLLALDDLDLLLGVEPGLFDKDIDPVQARAFLENPQHAIAVALDDGAVVAFASGSILLHPDKPPSMFVNEVGTRDSHLRRGCATAVSEALFAWARGQGCEGIWLATEPDNDAALGLYRRLGGEEMTIVGFAWDGAFDE